MRSASRDDDSGRLGIDPDVDDVRAMNLQAHPLDDVRSARRAAFGFEEVVTTTRSFVGAEHAMRCVRNRARPGEPRVVEPIKPRRAVD